MAASAPAPGEAAGKPLQSAMKLAKGALELDAGDRPWEAYVEYLKSISYISQALLEEAAAAKADGSDVTLDTPKMLKVAEQCLERAKSSIAKIGKVKAKLVPERATGPAPLSRHRRVLSDEGGKLSPFLPPEMFQKLQITEVHGTKRELSPLEEASLQNQKLKAAYEARLARLNPNQAVQKTSLASGAWPGKGPFRVCGPGRCWRKAVGEDVGVGISGGLPRLGEAAGRACLATAGQQAGKGLGPSLGGVLPGELLLSFSLCPADAFPAAPDDGEPGDRQSAGGDPPRVVVALEAGVGGESVACRTLTVPPPKLQRKMEERRLRLQEAANRRFSSNAALTTEEQEQRAIYAAVLEYEQDHEWPRVWKAQLKKTPSDLSLVPKLISHLLSFADHPICQLLKKLQCAVYSRVYPLVSRGTADVRAAGRASRGLSLSSSLDAEAFLALAPEGRRLRSSQSLHSMFSVQENNQLNLCHSLSSTPLIEDQGLRSPPGQGPPALGLPDRESSFEDLEQFLSALGEAWPPGPSPPAPPARKTASRQERLKAVVKDIHNAIDRLLSLTLLAFEGLNTAACKDQCVARLEEAFFAPLWAPLLAVYRSVYRSREAALARSMELYRNTPPRCPRHPSQAPPAEQPTPGGDAGRLPLLRGCAGADADPPGQLPAEEAGLHRGADDLLPILSFVVLKSNLPQLVSECVALEEFIHEGYLIGEEGYCLTSLQSALAYVESLPARAELSISSLRQ
ncbi:hypothetical protein lerEdw1_002793 [Lerista edwardsae]|nr:hypothetical protein lerEdw1_002793 [Lerista edwardsae]